MHPYQVMGIIVGCTIVFAGVVSLLTMQGVPILYAFLGVYFLAVWCMLGMQRRARESFEVREDLRLRRYERESLTYRKRARDFQVAGKLTSGRVEQIRI